MGRQNNVGLENTRQYLRRVTIPAQRHYVWYPDNSPLYYSGSAANIGESRLFAKQVVPKGPEGSIPSASVVSESKSSCYPLETPLDLLVTHSDTSVEQNRWKLKYIRS